MQRLTFSSHITQFPHYKSQLHTHHLLSMQPLLHFQRAAWHARLLYITYSTDTSCILVHDNTAAAKPPMTFMPATTSCSIVLHPAFQQGTVLLSMQTARACCILRVSESIYSHHSGCCRVAWLRSRSSSTKPAASVASGHWSSSSASCSSTDLVAISS